MSEWQWNWAAGSKGGQEEARAPGGAAGERLCGRDACAEREEPRSALHACGCAHRAESAPPRGDVLLTDRSASPKIRRAPMTRTWYNAKGSFRELLCDAEYGVSDRTSRVFCICAEELPTACDAHIGLH